MPYSPTTWVSGTTALSAPNMNNIENGIVAALRADGSVTPTAQEPVIDKDILATGHQVTTVGGGQQAETSQSGQPIGFAVPFPVHCTNVPSSLTLTTTGSQNETTLAANNTSRDGTLLLWFATAVYTKWFGTVATNGN